MLFRSALVNPKVVAASVVAGGQISVSSSTVDAAIAFAYYLAMATVTVAAPVITYLALGSRIDPKLERLRHWVQRHHIAATATTLIIIGVTILLYGLSSQQVHARAVNGPTRVVHRWVQPAA